MNSIYYWVKVNKHPVCESVPIQW